MNVDSVLAQIRAMQSQIRSAGGAPEQLARTAAQSGAGAPAAATSFSNVLRQGLDQVHQAQQRASSLAAQFERGAPGVELPQVMLEMQKASVSFRALTEVRNKFVDAYQSIMNMPI
ncbi:MAG TPA: flagellar hook-basal body complex protein FliE [Steroidobacter sp.]|nr:flagellar hook-basal body complex protein FliE [Steroidobacter sp.]